MKYVLGVWYIDAKTSLLYLVDYNEELLDSLTTEWVNAGYLKRLKDFNSSNSDEHFLEFVTYIEVDPDIVSGKKQA
jgi:hypothetical protein